MSKGFSVIINDISIFDYVQLILLENIPKTIEVINSKNEKGIIQIDDGKFVFAKNKSYKGEEALFEILSWEEGTIEEIDLTIKFKKNIKNNNNLLLKAAEWIDNKNKI